MSPLHVLNLTRLFINNLGDHFQRLGNMDLYIWIVILFKIGTWTSCDVFEAPEAIELTRRGDEAGWFLALIDTHLPHDYRSRVGLLRISRPPSLIFLWAIP